MGNVREINCDIIIIAGPTASGKTAVAVDVAKKIGGEVVSADSMQIYKYFSIGTAKPSPDECDGIPHHMIDFVEPEVKYDVASFKKDAMECINDIISRGRVPIVCGGTGLYIDSLIRNIVFEDVKTDPRLRAELEAIAENDGPESLYEILKDIDPDAAENIHPNNVKRVIRAVEATKLAGVPFSQQKKNAVSVPPDISYKLFFLNRDRELLYKRINKRVDAMIDAGLVDEARDMTERGYLAPEYTAAQAIGYKELLRYLNGDVSLEESVELLKRETRRYAKRQITWFKRYPELIRIECEDANGAEISAYEISDKIISRTIES